MEEVWKTYRIGDVCKIKRGASPRPIQQFLSDKGVPWVKIADATAVNSMYLDSTKEFIIDRGVSNSVTVLPGTLIVSNSATPGLPKIIRIKACVHDGWLIISDFNGVSKEFMYYKFVDIRSFLNNQANGSVFQNLKTDIVRDFPIKVPSLETQNKIVSILKSLDDKIECNKRINDNLPYRLLLMIQTKLLSLKRKNDNLEQQAQALFKSWFVDFEPFKDEERVESELGMIPKGWKVGCLSSIANYVNGLAMQKFRPEEGEQGLPVLKIKELGQGYVDNSCELCSPSKVGKKYLINNGDIIFSWSGTLMVKVWCGGICGLNQHLFVVVPRCYPKWFVYQWTKHHLDNFIRIAKDKAVTMGHINRSELDKAKTLIPDTKNMITINALMESIHNQILLNELEHQRLASLRDTLLPKLMSGKLKISD